MPVWLLALLLGVIEGITEFIPVSSTGHLLLAENLLGVKERAPFLTGELFNAFIQCWALLAALPLFRARLATLKNWREPKTRDYFLKLFAAFFLTCVGALLMKKNHWRLPESAVPIGIALLVGGALLIIVERWLRDRPRTAEISWTMALAIGAAQLVAMGFPGTSRSGATILVALVMGAGRPVATEFSFLLGVPTLFAAGAKTLYDAWKAHEIIDWPLLLIGSAAAAIASVLTVRWMLGYVRNHSFEGFGWYRIAAAAAVIGCYFAGWMH